MALYMLTSCDDCGMTDECQDYTDSERRGRMSGISKTTFESMDVDSKLCVLFDYMMEIQSTAPKRVRDRDLKCERQSTICNKRFNKLSKMKYINTAAAFAGGFIGGWSAVWASFKFSIFGS